MTGIISGIYTVVSGLVSFSVKASLTGVGAFIILSVATKPTEESFTPYYKRYIDQTVKNGVPTTEGWGRTAMNVVGSVASSAISSGLVSTFCYRDIGIAKLTVVDSAVGEAKSRMEFVGIFNGWQRLPDGFTGDFVCPEDKKKL
jgi:hypothetical protein